MISANALIRGGGQPMNKKKFFMTLTSVLLVVAIALGVIAFKEGWSIPILNPSDPQTGNGENNNGDDEPPVVDNSPRLPCFTFIDASLAKDGFTYLGEGQWG